MFPLNTSMKFFKYKPFGKSNTLPMSISNCCLNPASNINIKGTIVIKSQTTASIPMTAFIDNFFIDKLLHFSFTELHIIQKLNLLSFMNLI